MSAPRPWPPPPRGAFTPAAREHRLCGGVEVLALLHVLAGLAWPLLVVGTHAVDRWLPGIAGNRYWCALLGPTIASWGLLLWFVVRNGVRRGQRWACDAAIAAILVWLPLDFALCFAFRFVPGMILDPAVGLLMLGLLAAIHPRLPLD
ncbi:hypothetical protein [Solimonas terrae]|uniref:Uncharacterized protein n=1 Tax=Solimonas terrae TaxID=1396819 RepID=A0A6M2BVX4_9GAMM|nr:hypothetical protein [Solimonas terrae]NGY06534.1 hypothetical protein [Solimonas terrae]